MKQDTNFIFFFKEKCIYFTFIGKKKRITKSKQLDLKIINWEIRQSCGFYKMYRRLKLSKRSFFSTI